MAELTKAELAKLEERIRTVETLTSQMKTILDSVKFMLTMTLPFLGLCVIALTTAFFTLNSQASKNSEAVTTLKEQVKSLNDRLERTRGIVSTSLRVVEGKVVRVEDGKIVVEDTLGKERTFTLSPDAKISIKDKDARLSDLKPGMIVTVTALPGDVAIRIDSDN